MKTVFITGGAKRMGKGLALKFAEKGFNIFFTYFKNEQKAIEVRQEVINLGVNCQTLKADIRIESDIINSLNYCEKIMGFPDILINNAAVFPERKQLTETLEDTLIDVMNINYKGGVLFSKNFAKKAKQGSRIINIVSLGAYEIWKERLPYHGSKAAFLHASRAMAIEFAPNISVNAVCPGTIEFPDEPTENFSMNNPKKIPMQRLGNIDDIFDAVYFFSTCSNFITGQSLIVDGGYYYAR